ncbi:hypothetical protein SAY86_013153 [Trapa natans]|uniref:Uncharacterized protein n=1 Tax=Trapa natans TaxID=22666 RepID=A0AAN7LZ32_TRANT|nr:hypothetical protein SAY86_013153 [Trapa natans]
MIIAEPIQSAPGFFSGFNVTMNCLNMAKLMLAMMMLHLVIWDLPAVSGTIETACDGDHKGMKKSSSWHSLSEEWIGEVYGRKTGVERQRRSLNRYPRSPPPSPIFNQRPTYSIKPPSPPPSPETERP